MQLNITTVSNGGWMPQQDGHQAQHAASTLQNLKTPTHLHISLDEDEQKKSAFSAAHMPPFGLATNPKCQH